MEWTMKENDEGEYKYRWLYHPKFAEKKNVQVALNKQPWQTLLGKRWVKTHPWLEGEAVEIPGEIPKEHLPIKIGLIKSYFSLSLLPRALLQELGSLSETLLKNKLIWSWN